MNVSRLILICRELQDHGHDGDDGGAQDGHGVVQVIPRHLGGSEVMDLPEPEIDIDTETGQPEEDGEGGELEEEASDDTSTCVSDQARVVLVPDNYDQEGEREEEEERDLDGGHMVVPELVTGDVTDNDDDWLFFTASVTQDGDDTFVGKVTLEHLLPGRQYIVHIASKNAHQYNTFSEQFLFTTKEEADEEEKSSHELTKTNRKESTTISQELQRN